MGVSALPLAIMKVVLVFASLLALSAAASSAQFKRLVQPKNAITCSICKDIITELDNFITSDTTEDEIVAFVEQICVALGAILPDFVVTCFALVEANLPAIINGLVEDNMDPTIICEMLTACP